MKSTSSSLAGLPFPRRAKPVPSKRPRYAIILSLLAGLVAPWTVYADVNVTYAQIFAQTAAGANDGIGESEPLTIMEDLHQALGDFSANLRSYQEADNIFPFGPDLASSAEATLDYTAHAGTDEFSATFNESHYIAVNLAGGAGMAFTLFYYLIEFEITEAIEFHLVTTYAQGGNSFGHRLDFFRHGQGAAGEIVPSIAYDPLDVTGVLLPGEYTFGYQSNRLLEYDSAGSLRSAPGPTSLLMTFRGESPNAPGVPDAGTTLALLTFGFASLIATTKLAARSAA